MTTTVTAVAAVTLTAATVAAMAVTTTEWVQHMTICILYFCLSDKVTVEYANILLKINKREFQHSQCSLWGGGICMGSEVRPPWGGLPRWPRWRAVSFALHTSKPHMTIVCNIVWHCVAKYGNMQTVCEILLYSQYVKEDLFLATFTQRFA